MPFTLINPSFPLVAGGVTYSVPVTDMNTSYEIIGTQTITVDNVFQESGVAVEGMTYVWNYKAVATYSGGAVKFHGTALSTQQALKHCTVIAKYLGGAWDVDIIPDLSESDVIESSKILSMVYSKLTGITRGRYLTGDATNLPVLIDGTTDKGIPIGNSTDFTVQVISGAITISNTGVAAFVAGQMTTAGLAANAGIVFTQLAALPSAQLLIGSAGNVPTATAVTGDITITNAGVTAIGNAKVVVAMVEATLRDNVVGACSVLFTTGNLFADGQLNEFTCPYNCDITFGFAEVTTLIEATNAATVGITINGVAVTNGTITLTAGAVAGAQFTCTPTGAMSVTAGQKIGLHTAKTNSGGRANVYLTLRRT